MKLIIGTLTIFVLLSFWFKPSTHGNHLIDIPEGFPDVIFPEGNELTAERINLGKRLFFDPLLSRDYSISCASCHKPHLAFSDLVDFSIGSDLALGKSNAPTLTNVAYSPSLNRDGGVPTLEMQALIPIQEHIEFDMNILVIAERMNLDSTYIKQSLEAYNRVPDPYVITRSIASFERTLISGNSKYDTYFYQGNKKSLTKEEKKGMTLFFSEENQCSTCHGGFTFTNFEFKNNGLYEQYADSGRFRITKNESDRATFKVPTLRNIEYTAPYMHDGSINTLEEVVEHYSTGIKNHKNLSQEIKPLHFSQKEKSQLVAFLKTLSDTTFINNPKFRNH